MELNDQNFKQEALNSAQPVLVDFFAEWCGPCKMQAPIIEELEKEYQGKIKIFPLDVDKNQQTAGSYQVMSIPTMILFKGGKEVERLMGLQNKGVLKEKLENLLII
ncbi:MAG: thioredoxin [Candidatus Komeilibacteria bacterium]|nr:thioredoxin [Candidatus Komeilibacteria bacterium]